ncbi:MAG: hypothetical protein ACYC6H_08985 [Bellilinea sp.]
MRAINGFAVAVRIRVGAIVGYIRTAASLMMNHQVPILVASRRLGHSKPSVTLDIYSHLYQESQNDVAILLDELVTPVAVEWPKVHARKESG